MFSKYLPSSKIAYQRRKECKPWLIGLLTFTFGPVALIFSYRHKNKKILITFFSIALFIVLIRQIYPEPIINGRLFIPLINWLIYSRYGPMLMQGLSIFYITLLSKEENSPKKNLTLTTKNDRNELLVQDNIFENIVINEDTEESLKKDLLELKRLFEGNLIDEEEYKKMKAKLLKLEAH